MKSQIFIILFSIQIFTIIFLINCVDMKISCQMYHAGMSANERKNSHHQFVHDKIQVSNKNLLKNIRKLYLFLEFYYTSIYFVVVCM